MRRYLCVIVMIIVLGVSTKCVHCDKIDYYEISPELHKIQNILNKNSDVYNDVLGKTPKEMILDLLKGRFKFSMKDFIIRIVKLMSHEIRSNVRMLVGLTMVAILTSILKNMQSSFCNDELASISFYACNIVANMLLFKCFNNCINITKGIIDDIGALTVAVVPVSTSLMMSCGEIVKVSAVKPFILCGVSMLVYAIKKISLPLVYISTVIKVVSSITSRVEVTKIGKLIQSASNFVSGFLLTVFIGVVAIKGAGAQLVDGITTRTAKYMFGACIPVVGKYLSDIADNVIASLVMIKSVVGIASVIGIILMCVIPIIKLASVVIVLKLMEALLEPVVDKRFSKLVGEVSTSVSSMIGIVFLVGVVIILSIKIFLT